MKNIVIRNFIKLCSWGSADNMSAFVQMMAWRLTGDKPLPEPMLTKMSEPYGVIRPQWIFKLPYEYMETS